MRFLYSFVLLSILPMVIFWVALFRRALLPGLCQRLGFSLPSTARCVWIHAASVGEVVAAQPLIKKIQEVYPNLTLLVSTGTATGAAQVKSLFGESALHVYFPYDLAIVVRRFLVRLNPRLIVLMETEFWPNLLAEAHKRGVPVAIVNGRISSQTFPHYRRFHSLFAPVLSKVAVLVAQTQQDSERYCYLGIQQQRVTVSGNTKFDVTPSWKLIEQGHELRRKMGEHNFVWLAASTHPGEESPILAVHQALLAHEPSAKLILLPRHPERFTDVARLIEHSGFSYIRKSNIKNGTYNDAVILGDTMGEMTAYMIAADLIFMAGSLVPIGGHNPLEAAVLSKPILSGPYIENFRQIFDELENAQACEIVADDDALLDYLKCLCKQPLARERLAENAKSIYTTHKSATEITLDTLRPYL